MEEELHERPLYREFAGLAGSPRIPDETTILRFRHLLEKHDLAAQVMATINAGLVLASIEVHPNRVGVIRHGVRAVSAVHTMPPTRSALRGWVGVRTAKPCDEASASLDAMTFDARRSVSFDNGTAAHTYPQAHTPIVDRSGVQRE